MNVVFVVLLVMAAFVAGIFVQRKWLSRSSAPGLNQKGSLSIASAFAQLTDEEYAQVRAGNLASLIQHVEELKGNRLSEIEFKQQQYDAYLAGAQKARKDHLRNLRDGDGYDIANYLLKRADELDRNAAKIAKELGIFNQ